ncbi:MAG: CPBP family intramembrane metalloprotease [Bacteroidetes bacterium]|nr:CPBP family intramembrane metalloprotease [Bacteroidota bacterium]
MKNNTIFLYSLVLIAVSWAVAGIFYLTGLEFSGTTALLFGFGYMFLPSLVAIALKPKGVSFRNLVYLNTRLNIWYLWAWIIPPVLVLASVGMALWLPGVEYSPDMSGMFDRFADKLSPDDLALMKAQMELLPVHPFWIGLVGGMFAGATLNLVAGMGEEMGWRGYLLRAFEGKGFMSASLITGFIWGIWHAPIILMGHNYPDHPQLGVLMMTVWCILLAPMFLYLTLKAKSVLAAGLMHGTLNGTAGTALVVLNGGSDLTVGVTGISGFMALVVILTVIAAYDYFSGQRIMWSTINLAEHSLTSEAGKDSKAVEQTGA